MPIHDHCTPPRSPSRAIAYLPSPPSYATFQALYLLPLQPLIFNDDDLPSKWPCHSLWTRRVSDSTGDVVPDLDALAETFRGKRATVAYAGGYGEGRREEILFEEFASLWNGSVVDEEDVKGELPYLKDFHLCLARPDYMSYGVYDLFQDDWLNLHALLNTPDDFRFLYLGPAGSYTGWHHDVFLSHSWSTSLTGVKKWTLIAPDDAHLLLARITHEPPPTPYLEGLDESEYPGILEARERALVVWQYPNETIFVPSGWYHSVVNFGPALSINHNWANASCLPGMYAALAEQTSQSIALLSDIEDPSERACLAYDNVCRPSWGWSFAEFWAVVECALDDLSEGAGPGAWPIAPDARIGVKETKRRIYQAAHLWLEREEATEGWMPELEGKVRRTILQRCS